MHLMGTKTLAWAGIAVIVVAMTVSGCGKPKEQGPAAGTAPAGAVKAVNLWTIWNAEPRKSALNDIVAAFNREHPDIKVIVTNLEPDAYKTSIRVRLGSADPPDIYFVWSGEWMHNFVRSGAVADITKDMDAGGGEWRKRINAGSLKRFTYDGKTWGVPYLLQCTFFFYNKAIFQKLGLAAPKTWPELLAAVDKINASSGRQYVPIALGNTLRWPAQIMTSAIFERLMGEETVEADYDPMGPGAYSEPEWVGGIEMLQELVRHKAFNAAPNAVTREAARAMLYSGKAAMFYTGTWDFARLVEGGEAPKTFWTQWDFFNFPAVPGGKGDQTAMTGSPDGYVVCSRSKNPEAAVEFLKYMTSVKVAQEFVRRCQELVQVEGAVTKENAKWPLSKYAEMVAKATQVCPWTDTMIERSVVDELTNGLQAAIDGQAKAADVMAAVRAKQAEAKKRLQAEAAKAKG
jgi:raffinose/stachyose/melibiose transport system substrate-binding protein